MSWLRDKPPSRQQYTITTDRAPRRSLEHAVRPFQTIESAPPELPPVRRNRPGEDTEASICAGGPSRFLRQDLEEPVQFPGGGFSFEVIWPDRPPSDDDEPEEDDPGAFIFDEEWRVTSVIRVVNPEDAAQYVDVERIESIAFKHFQTGRNYVFRLKHE